MAHRLPTAHAYVRRRVGQSDNTSVNAASDSVRKALGGPRRPARHPRRTDPGCSTRPSRTPTPLLDQAVQEDPGGRRRGSRARRRAGPARKPSRRRSAISNAARLQAQEEAAATPRAIRRRPRRARSAGGRRTSAVTDTASALAEAQHEVGAAPRAWADQNAQLDEAHQQIRSLEEDHAQWTLGRQVAEAHLEEERQRRKTDRGAARRRPGRAASR